MNMIENLTFSISFDTRKDYLDNVYIDCLSLWIKFEMNKLTLFQTEFPFTNFI